MNKQYLGDSVYIEKNTLGQFKLFLDNGEGEHTVIILEPEVAAALVNYLSK